MEMAEAAGLNLSLISLDWSKAFDKLEHEALFHCLKRLGIRGKMLNCIKSLYSDSSFLPK